MKTLFFVIVAVLQVVLLIIPTLGKLYNEPSNGNSYRITPPGIFFLATVILSLGFSIGLYFISEADDWANKENIKQHQEKRDSIIATEVAKGVDSNRKILFTDLSVALAKQNLKIDTVTKTLNKLSDSTNKSITNIISSEPVLNIQENGISLLKKNNEYTFVISLKSYDAASTNFDLTLHTIATPIIGPNVYFGKTHPVLSTTRIGKESGMDIDIVLNWPTELTQAFFYLIGSYSNIDGTKSYKIKSLYKFDFTTKKTYIAANKTIENAILDIIPK